MHKKEFFYIYCFNKILTNSVDRVKTFIPSRAKLYSKVFKIHSEKKSYCYHHYISTNCS